MENLLIATNLNLLMANARVSASELGRRTGLPAATIQKVRTGEHINPTVITLYKLAQYFGVTISQITGELSLKAVSSANLMDVTMPNSKEWVEASIISWEEAMHSSLEQFNLVVNSDKYSKFPKDSVILVDKKFEYKDGDYVLVKSSLANTLNIKRIFREDGIYYLQSLLDKQNLVTVENNYIIGVICSYYKRIK